MNTKEQQLEERQDTRIVIPPPEVSQVDLRIDPKEYEDFLRREKKLELMSEIKEWKVNEGDVERRTGPSSAGHEGDVEIHTGPLIVFTEVMSKDILALYVDSWRWCR